MKDSKSYSTYIANQFGGLNKDKLKICLEKLIRLSKVEGAGLTILDVNTNGKEYKLENEDFQITEHSILNKHYLKRNFDASFINILDSDKNVYEKCAVIIELVKHFHKILEFKRIPESLFNTFWIFVENPNYHIQLDETGEKFFVEQINQPEKSMSK